MLRHRNVNIQRLHWPRTFNRSRAMLVSKIATILVATVAVFYSGLALVFNDILKSEYAIYILAVPVVVIYLVYRKRKMLRAVLPLNSKTQSRNIKDLASLTGILVAATAVLIYWRNSYASTPLEVYTYAFAPSRLQILALPFFVAGLVLILFNQETLKQLALPIAFLSFLTPPTSDTFGLGLIGAFIFISAGTTIFVLVSRRTHNGQILPRNPGTCAECSHEPRLDRSYCMTCGKILHPVRMSFHRMDAAKIALILLIASLLVTIQAPVFAINKRTPLIPLNTSSGQEYSTTILPQISQYTPEWWGEGQALETKAHNQHQDLLAIEYVYLPISNGTLHTIYVGLEISSLRSSLPDYAFPARTIQLNHSQIQINNNYGTPIQAQYFAYEYTDTNEIVALLYWYSSPTLMINNQTAQQKQMQTALTVNNLQEDQLPEVKQQLIDLATQISNYQLPSETLPEVTARSLSQYGAALATATSIGIVLTLAYCAAETRKQRKASLAAIAKLNTLNKEIVQAVQKTKKPATISSIAETFLANTGKTITLEQLEEQLRELEKVSIIKSQVYSQNNIPIQTWKM